MTYCFIQAIKSGTAASSCLVLPLICEEDETRMKHVSPEFIKIGSLLPLCYVALIITLSAWRINLSNRLRELVIEGGACR